MWNSTSITAKHGQRLCTLTDNLSDNSTQHEQLTATFYLVDYPARAVRNAHVISRENEEAKKKTSVALIFYIESIFSSIRVGEYQ